MYSLPTIEALNRKAAIEAANPELKVDDPLFGERLVWIGKGPCGVGRYQRPHETLENDCEVLEVGEAESIAPDGRINCQSEDGFWYLVDRSEIWPADVVIAMLRDWKG